MHGGSQKQKLKNNLKDLYLRETILKILQVIPYFSPAYAFGGPVQVAYQVAKELVKRKHEVVVYTTDAKDFDSRLNVNAVEFVDGIKVCYFRNLTMKSVKKSKLFITPHMISRTNKEVKTFDIIHLHEYRTLQNIVIAHYAKKHHVPYVLHAHGSLPRIMMKQTLKRIYDVFFGYKLLSDASKVIAVNRIEAEQYRHLNILNGKIEIIPNGIDLSEYNSLPCKGSFRKKFSIVNHEKIVLYLGRIHKIKGLDVLVEAFAKLDETFRAKLVIVGPDDGYLSELETLIKALKIDDNVLITGPLYGKDKLEAYVDADIYVLPSIYETFPMTVLEAVACGTPIILSENCGIAEHFRDKAGLVVKPDVNLLHHALIKMLVDQEKAQKYGHVAHKLLKDKFSIQKVVDSLETLYESVLS